jgi:homoserine dehydrogenase
VEAVQQNVRGGSLDVLSDGQEQGPPTATLVIGTHEATEAALAATVEALEGSDVVVEVSSVLRVEGL